MHRHQAREDGVAGILRRRRQDTIIETLVEGKVFRQQVFDDAPLVVAEIIYQDEKDFLPLVEHREDAPLEEVRAHQRSPLGRRIAYPVEVAPADELPEGLVCLRLLHPEHLAHRDVARFQLQLPIDELLIDLFPVRSGQRVVDLHPDARELLLVAHGGRLRYDDVLMYVLFDGKEELVGIDGLDEIVRYLVAYRLVHDAFLLAFGNHDDGDIGL